MVVNFHGERARNDVARKSQTSYGFSALGLKPRDCHGYEKPAGECRGLAWGLGTGWVYPTLAHTRTRSMGWRVHHVNLNSAWNEINALKSFLSTYNHRPPSSRRLENVKLGKWKFLLHVLLNWLCFTITNILSPPLKGRQHDIANDHLIASPLQRGMGMISRYWRIHGRHEVAGNVRGV